METNDEYIERMDREERERDLEQQRENNDDGRTDAEMYDEYGPFDDDNDD
jgi:hypothetical protein